MTGISIDDSDYRSPMCRDMAFYLRDNPGVTVIDIMINFDDGRWGRSTVEKSLETLIDDGLVRKRLSKYYPV